METEYTLVGTGEYDPRASIVIDSVIGQMSDGLWENVRAYGKYWQHCDFCTTADGMVCIAVDTENGGFKGMTPKRVRNFFSRRIRDVVSVFEEYHGSDKNAICTYLNSGSKGDRTITVEYCLALADRLEKYKP